jgi:hypothetical protein
MWSQITASTQNLRDLAASFNSIEYMENELSGSITPGEQLE